jgi:hypothetical protein
MLVAVEQPSNPERGIGAELGDHLAGKLRVRLRLGARHPRAKPLSPISASGW